MSTLNIKNVPEDLYVALQEQAKREHRSVAQQAIHLLAQSIDQPRTRSLLEFKGIARNSPTGMDAAEYIRGERAAW